MTDRKPARPEWAALETVHKLADAEVALVSPQQDWDLLAATRFRLGKVDVSLPALGVPAFGVNYGPDMRLERTLHGRKVSGLGRAGHLSLLPPDADTRWVFDKPGDIVLVVLNRQFFERLAAERGKSAEIVPQFVIRDLTLERIAHQLLREIAEPTPERRLTIETLAKDLAGHLIDAHSNLEPPQRSGPRTIPPLKLKRAEEFVLSNLDAELSLQEIAKAAGMSLFHFAKAFKQSTGQTPLAYVKEQRLRHARALLHDTRLSIADVAKAVGYSHSYFTAEFRDLMKMTPSEFRNVLRS